MQSSATALPLQSQNALSRVAVFRTQLPDFNAQNLANTAWALATLGHNDPLFMSDLTRAAEAKLQEFNAQDYSNTAWALATLGELGVDTSEMFGGKGAQCAGR